MTPKEKRDAKNARHKRNEQRRRQRWLDRLWNQHIKLWVENPSERDKQA